MKCLYYLIFTPYVIIGVDILIRLTGLALMDIYDGRENNSARKVLKDISINITVKEILRELAIGLIPILNWLVALPILLKYLLFIVLVFSTFLFLVFLYIFKVIKYFIDLFNKF